MCGIRLDSVRAAYSNYVEINKKVLNIKYAEDTKSNSRPITSFLIITLCRQLVGVGSDTHNICAFSMGNLQHISHFGGLCVHPHTNLFKTARIPQSSTFKT